MKKMISILIAVVFAAVVFCIPGFAETDEFLEAIQGNYIELFPEFAKEEFHDYWMECIGAYTDDPETAEALYQMLVSSCMGKLMGQEAVEAYTAAPESIVFDCFFENGPASFTVEGDVISGLDADGNVLFSHTYSFVEDVPMNLGGMTMEGYDFHLYKADEEGDNFTWFAFADDTPVETYHLEFRYGANAEGIGTYYEGPYAYWLAAAISSNYAESTMMQDCIKLFTDENLSEMFAEAEAAQ